MRLFISFVLIAIVNVPTLAEANDPCDLSKVVAKENPTEAANTYANKTMIANPYFAHKIWEEFCTHAVAANSVTKSPFHPHLFAMNVAGIFECRMFKIISEGVGVNDTTYYQCAVTPSADLIANGTGTILGGESAKKLWDFWGKEAIDINGEKFKSVVAVSSMPTHHRLIFQDDAIECRKADNSDLKCFISNDARSRGL